jgi:hypothetical protein
MKIYYKTKWQITKITLLYFKIGKSGYETKKNIEALILPQILNRR